MYSLKICEGDNFRGIVNLAVLWTCYCIEL